MKKKYFLQTAALFAAVTCTAFAHSKFDTGQPVNASSAFASADELKKVILQIDSCDDIDEYDINGNGKVNVFDYMRQKKVLLKEHSETTSYVPSTLPSETVTTAVTTTPEPPVTTTTTTKATTVTTAKPVTTTTTTTTTPQVTTKPAPPVTAMPDRKIISNMRSVLQSPELPTGCEATGLTIFLNWYGYDVDKVTIAMKFMPRMEFYYDNGRLIGADFITTFAGNPTTTYLSYGCYIPCLQRTADSYLSSVGSPYRSVNLTGTELNDLFKYVAQGKPVVVIMTPELVAPRTGDSWYTPDGRYVTWQRGHHCMVLMGYDKQNNKVYCADPMMRAGIVEYDMNQFRNIYNLKGKNAMILDADPSSVASVNASKGENIKFSGYMYTSSDGGSSRYVSGVYTVTDILNNSSPYPVCLGNIGWVPKDALKVNIPTYSSQSSGSIANGTYNLRNAASSKYLNVDYGHDVNGTNVYQWTRDGSTEQKFRIQYYPGDDTYRLFAMCSSSGYDKMVSAGAPSHLANVHIYAPGYDDSQKWQIVQVNGSAYKIVLKSHPDLALTVCGMNNGYSTAADWNSEGNVFVAAYTNSASQLWYFTPVS